MPSQQGDLSLLQQPVAQKLLHSTGMARLAYNWTDGTPRVVPIWFHWTGDEIVFGSPVDAPKVRVLQNASVAITIDSESPPYNVLMIRGTARINIVDGIAPEYTAAATRYYGAEGAQVWLAQLGALTSQMARISVKPEWVGTLDFETRFPSAIESAIAAAQR